MNAGFISPTFRVLEVNWEHDYEMVKLGVPTVMGYLYRAGHRDLRQWDFDAQVCDAIEADSSSFDLRAYFDEAAVKGFINGTDESLRAQTEKILDTLEVTKRDVYGISLSAVLDRIVNVVALAGIGQCVSKVLKERYPDCTIIFGGLQVSPESLHEGYYKRFMEECPHIDYSFMRMVSVGTVQMFRNIWNKQPERMRYLPAVIRRERDAQGIEHLLVGNNTHEIDHDLQSFEIDLREKHHRSHTQAGAAAKAASAITAATSLSEKSGMFASSSLVRHKEPSESMGLGESTDSSGPTGLAGPTGPIAATTAIAYEKTHHEDGSEVSAREASDGFDYSTIPARVPIFDPELVDRFRYSGQQIMKRFHFDKEMLLRYSRYENDRIVVLPHIFVKGCNAPCGFCTYAYRPIEGEDVIETVEGLKFLSETYNCKHFHFLNTQINSVYNYADSFCDAIIAAKLNIFWSDCANMRMLDEPLLDKLRQSGAMRLVYGVEAPEDEMLRYIHKGCNVEKIKRLLKHSHDLGIWNHVLLIAGMPHETKAKQDRMMDFLTWSAPVVDFYSISSYYLISSSPWGRDPDKFGIERLTDPNGQLLEEQAFNEKAEGRWSSDNLKWPEKKQQIVQSTRRFYKTISAAKGQSRCVGGNIDLYLLMFLYSVLGHDQKAEISRIYTETAKEIMPTRDQNKGSGEGGTFPEDFQINIPFVIGRVNEGDQSSLVQVPITIKVAERKEGQNFWCSSQRYSYSYRTPRAFETDDRFSATSMESFRELLPQTMGVLGQTLTPFLRSLDLRFAPTTAARMAELAANNLPKYKPFANFGYTVVAPSTTRTIMERNLQWSGHAT